MENSLLDAWRRAASELGLEIYGPVDISLSPSETIRVDVLVKDFGGPNGTVVVDNFDKIRSIADRLIELDYGFSTLRPMKEDETYDKEVLIEMLSEWGWAGAPGHAPSWLLPDPCE